MVFCGIDWAEDHHDVCLVDESGGVLWRTRIDHEPSDAAVLADALRTDRASLRALPPDSELGREIATLARDHAALVRDHTRLRTIDRILARESRCVRPGLNVKTRGGARAPNDDRCRPEFLRNPAIRLRPCASGASRRRIELPHRPDRAIFIFRAHS